jgi:sarcosine oxidase/L-pipecolate oxidase
MESGEQTDVIYTDFSRAFNSVNHSILIAKLRLFSLTDPFIFFIHSYLINRIQQVKINGFLSDTIKVPSGVPQGGHLFPLLFAIFILDTKLCFKY